jgi:predicted TIM-barrel fold metal-dependent hydrolase
MTDIVDTQVHFNMIGSLEAGIAAMDALGISGVMFDEWSHFDEQGRSRPGELLANGEMRPLCPLAEAAATQHPGRFGILRRVGHRDPELRGIARQLADAPYCGALRLLADTPELAGALGNGDMDHVFDIARDHALPIFVLTNGTPGLVRRQAERLPGLTIAIDHCGLAHERAGTGAALDVVLELARYPNVVVKWSHATYFLAKMDYPFADVIPWLRRVISAFGERRVMWGSDFTITAGFASWAEELFYIRDAPGLSDEEKSWLLGKTARAVLNWNAAEGAGAPRT